MPIVTAVLYIVLMWALTTIGRANELHHGYMGVVLLLAPHLVAYQAIIGLTLLADDVLQHAVEAFALLIAHKVINDFTPIHWAGVGIILLWEKIK